MIDVKLARKLVHGKPWHHDFEIMPGCRTHGAYNPEYLWSKLDLPKNMNGLSLADVGASNGYFSFQAFQSGAKVVAFDFRHKDNSGFGLAQYINGTTQIEHNHVNVLNISPGKYGQFDIVLALGLLYHVADPYRALSNCAALSRGRLLIESYCIDSLLPSSLASEPIMKFLPDPDRFPMQGQPNADRSNFWGFNATCLQCMVEDVGFKVERCDVERDRVFIDATRILFEDNATRLNIAYESLGHISVNGDPDDLDAWKIF